jgi:hypothetical protein
MLLTHDYILLASPVCIERAEAAIRIAIEMFGAILLPQQLLGGVFMLPQLLLNVFPIG